MSTFYASVQRLAEVNARAIASHMRSRNERELIQRYLRMTTQAPPITVNPKLELADGTHRLCVAILRGDTEILAQWDSPELRYQNFVRKENSV